MRAVKLGVCAAALWYLAGKVTLYDRVTLAAEPDKRYAVVERRDQTLRIRDPLTRAERVIHAQEIARPEQLPPGQRPLEVGLRTVFLQTDWRWTAWAIAVIGPVVFIISWRLQYLLAMQGIRLGYRNALLLTFAGNFFNFALPGTTGGDVYKAYQIARRTHKRTEGITVILLDRAIGLISFLLLAAGTIFWSWERQLIGDYGRWVGYLLAALFIASAVFFSQRVRRWIGYERILQRLPLADKLRRVDETAFRFRHHPYHAVVALAVTIVSHMFIVASVYFLARGLGVHPRPGQSAGELFLACLLATVVGYLFAAIPISIQGFGLLEAVFIRVLVTGGWCNLSQMIALTVGTRLIQILWSLPGAIVPWLGFERPVPAPNLPAEAPHLGVAEGR